MGIAITDGAAGVTIQGNSFAGIPLYAFDIEPNGHVFNNVRVGAHDVLFTGNTYYPGAVAHMVALVGDGEIYNVTISNNRSVNGTIRTSVGGLGPRPHHIYITGNVGDVSGSDYPIELRNADNVTVSGNRQPLRSGNPCVPDRLYWGRHRLARERGGRSEPGGVASLDCAAVSLRQHFAVFRSFAWLIVLSVATAVTASIALTAIVPRLYEARATLSVGQSLGSEAIDYDDLLASQALGRTYARLAPPATAAERCHRAHRIRGEYVRSGEEGEHGGSAERHAADDCGQRPERAGRSGHCERRSRRAGVART